MLFKDVTPTCKDVHQTRRKAEKSVTVDSSQADIARSSPSVETAKHAESHFWVNQQPEKLQRLVK